MPSPKRYASSAAKQKAYRLRQQNVQTQPPIPAKPGPARWRALRKNALFLLEALAAKMREFADQGSEAWQESEKAQDFEERQGLVGTAYQATLDIP